jgi:hypothetical protein
VIEWGLEPDVCNDDETSLGLMSEGCLPAAGSAAARPFDAECLSWTGGGAKTKAGVTIATTKHHSVTLMFSSIVVAASCYGYACHWQGPGSFLG